MRQLARHLGLPVWNKPQLACLSSRFPYGTSISPARLRMVDRFEQGLADLGFTQLRVRFHELPKLPGDKATAPTAELPPALARVELLAQELARGLELQREIVALGKRAGFVYVTLDLEGFRSGSANVVLRRLPLLGSRPAAASPAAASPAAAQNNATASPAAAPGTATASTPAAAPSAASPAAEPATATASPSAAASPVAFPGAAQKAAPATTVRSRKLVVAGLLREPGSGAVLLSQRRADQAMPLQWELPGGKVEPGEAPEAALVREVREELGVGATVLGIDEVISHQYEAFDLLMLVYRCTLDGAPAAREVADVRLVPRGELLGYDVLPADIPLVQRLAAEEPGAADEPGRA